MTRDDIIRMADENGIVIVGEAMFRFAALVADHEREACVQIVEREASAYAEPVWAVEIVNDIRARGET